MKKTLLLAAIAGLLTASVAHAQLATTAKTFRMFNTPTNTVSITASTAAGTGTFYWPQPTAGIFKSDAGGNMSIGPVALGSVEVTGILNVSNGGTGNITVGAPGSVAYSDGSKITYTGVGTTGQIFVSNGAASPSWTSSFPTGLNVPFNQISSGTNTGQTLIVGTGSTLDPTGTGSITANKYITSASTTDAVDLNTTEVSGTLPVTNGGTGLTSVGIAGSTLYSNGTGLSVLPPGTAGQVLAMNGSATATTWTSILNAGGKGTVTGNGTDYAYTVTPGGTFGATSQIFVTVEGPYSVTFVISSHTATDFTVEFPFVIPSTVKFHWIYF